ncbi:MAG: 1,4-alpha-glucan branching protein [bacterium]|nr:1,4-alpha-glucan branching protein [bacterium]
MTSPLTGTGADVYVREGAPPSLTDYDLRSATPGTSAETVLVGATSVPQLSSGTWWVGVWRPQSTTYDLVVELETAPATHTGFGAVLFEDGSGGTAFRVWAPHATGVHVAGTFNSWNASQAELHPEAGGVWSLDYRGVGAGAQYKYVLTTPSGTLWKNDPYAKDLTSSVGNSIVFDPDAYSWSQQSYTTPAWNDLVIYELHVGTFFDAPGGQPGSFATALLRLDHLQDLGVNAIEVMPACEFAGDYSWGYNYSYPYAIESAYGSPDAFKNFVDEAHARGIAVMLDVVYNHLGPSDLDMWRFDGWSQGPWGGIYFYNDDRGQTPWGDTRPDYGRGEVRSYIRDNALMWLEEYRCDGLRWDSTSFMRMGPSGDIPDAWSLMQWANDSIDGSQPWKIQIAEDLFDAPNEWITRPTMAGGAGYDAQWDALFVHPVRAAVETPDDDARNMWDVRSAVTQYYNGDAFERVIYTESHDEVANGRQRVPEEIWPGNAGSYFSKKRSTLAAALVFTAPGIPMLFQGQEILEDGFFQDTDPVDWTKLATYAGIFQMYKDMIAMRRNFAGTTRGLMGNSTNFHHTNNGDKVIAFHRWDQGGAGDDVVVVANFRNRAWDDYRVGLPRAGQWKVRFNSDWDGYDASFGNHPSPGVTAEAVPYDGMPYSASLSFGAYTAIVLSQ